MEINTPKYLIIEQEIQQKISDGIYQPGSMLPSENALAEYYQVSRVTIRNALNNLSQRGIIFKQQGSGTFVSNNPQQTKSPVLKSFTAEMEETGHNVSTEVLSFNIVQSGQKMGEVLGIEEDSRVYFIERLRKSDDIPMMFERTFMSLDKHPSLSFSVLETSKITYADEQGFEISHSDQIVEPYVSDNYISNILGIPMHTPILRVKNTTYLMNGEVFDYTENYIHPLNYQFSIRKQRA